MNQIKNLGNYAKKGIRGKETGHWKGGTTYIDGYKYTFKPKHPNATKQGYVCEHRMIMEKHVGRYLTKTEVVHHGNGNTLDNRFENLALLKDQGEHNNKYHFRQRDKLGRFVPWG